MGAETLHVGVAGWILDGASNAHVNLKSLYSIPARSVRTSYNTTTATTTPNRNPGTAVGRTFKRRRHVNWKRRKAYLLLGAWTGRKLLKTSKVSKLFFLDMERISSSCLPLVHLFTCQSWRRSWCLSLSRPQLARTAIPLFAWAGCLVCVLFYVPTICAKTTAKCNCQRNLPKIRSNSPDPGRVKTNSYLLTPLDVHYVWAA